MADTRKKKTGSKTGAARGRGSAPKGRKRRKRVTLTQRWKRAGFAKRFRIVSIGTVVVVVVVALVTGLVHFLRWYNNLQDAEARQLELSQQYNFDPGNIISDGQFFNGNAMSEAEIQAFLESKGGAIASMRFDTQTQKADDLCGKYQGAAKESAAAIIEKSGRACKVSQKVLLTVLQKEQHLVTATDPSDFQLKSAMGLSCPDDDSCDPQYAGFFKQVFGAAKRYQYYVKHEDDYGYQSGKLTPILYNPNKACGTSDVYIRNKATALLYIYTPYQPNKAALEAGDGEGDECSSYGNRNFSNIYSYWFGNPRN